MDECAIFYQKSLQESVQLYAATTLYRDTQFAQAANPNYNGVPPVQPEVELTDFQCVAFLTYLDWALIEHEETYPAHHATVALNPSTSVHWWLL